MPAPTLTPADAQTDYALTVSQVDLNDAENQILALTAYTLAEHVDTRNIYVGNVRRAWAIVAARMREQSAGDDTRYVTGESQGDYSYSQDADMKATGDLSVMSGAPNQLLNIGAEWASFSQSAYDRATRTGVGRTVPATLDDHGVAF